MCPSLVFNDFICLPHPINHKPIFLHNVFKPNRIKPHPSVTHHCIVDMDVFEVGVVFFSGFGDFSHFATYHGLCS
jgi:hypothetical protein